MAKPEEVEIANGTKLQITREIDLTFTLYDHENIKYTSKFHVIEADHNNAIIGMKFLRENDAIIDLKHNVLKVDGFEYQIASENEKVCFADMELIEKSHALNINDDNSKIGEIITAYKNKNRPIGDINIFHHKINLTGNFNKIMNEYPVPLGIRKDVEDHLNELINAKIITETNTEYISPAFIIKKKNGKLRLVVDYRYLNSITQKTHQYLPKISEIIVSLKDAKIFSPIDLNQGYYQIRMYPNDIPKTGFKILRRTFVFNKMPFGLCNAPTTFQLTMEAILKGIPNIFIYLDDILIYSKNISDHLKHLNTVLKRLITHGVSINYEKSKFGLESVKYLGHVITPEGIKPEISKIEAFELKPIKTKKQLERLLGFLNWFRPFIPRLSQRTASLYETLKSNSRSINISESELSTIKEIIQIIKEQPLLHYPDFNTPFQLNCDASDNGIGSILLQDNKLIGYYSKKYSPSEVNYTVIEKEVLAILKSLQHFKQIVFNTKIHIYTDNANLLFNGDISRRINRWKLIMEEFNYELHHISGTKNTHADFLSRAFLINGKLKNKDM
ncbi:Retrovirus-related Pol polyprotein from transposon 17.6 [Dictyocoela roeselum]|nr:Retrovirus-related Pol polyprotein from transposon 17.6 [Dictyocoela roeselum]